MARCCIGLKNQTAQTRRKIELLPHQIATLALPMPKSGKNRGGAHQISGAAETHLGTVRAANSRENITTREVPIVRAECSRGAESPHRLRARL